MIDGMRPKDRETRGRDRRISGAVDAKRAVVRAHAGSGGRLGKTQPFRGGNLRLSGRDALAVGEARENAEERRRTGGCHLRYFTNPVKRPTRS